MPGRHRCCLFSAEGGEVCPRTPHHHLPLRVLGAGGAVIEFHTDLADILKVGTRLNKDTRR